MAAKLYDPLGIISPIFLPVKLIFQELCKLKVDWDEPLSEEMRATLFGQLKIGQLFFGQLNLASYFMQIRLYLEGLEI